MDESLLLEHALCDCGKCWWCEFKSELDTGLENAASEPWSPWSICRTDDRSMIEVTNDEESSDGDVSDTGATVGEDVDAATSNKAREDPSP